MCIRDRIGVDSPFLLVEQQDTFSFCSYEYIAIVFLTKTADRIIRFYGMERRTVFIDFQYPLSVRTYPKDILRADINSENGSFLRQLE